MQTNMLIKIINVIKYKKKTNDYLYLLHFELFYVLKIKI